MSESGEGLARADSNSTGLGLHITLEDKSEDPRRGHSFESNRSIASVSGRASSEAGDTISRQKTEDDGLKRKWSLREGLQRRKYSKWNRGARGSVGSAHESCLYHLDLLS